MPDSIQRRLMLTSSAVLVIFLTATGLLLDRTFSQSVTEGAQQQLQLVVYSLMGAASEEGQQLRFNEGFAEPRLGQPDSGLYALVSNARGDILWRSRSAALTEVSRINDRALIPGDFVFRQSKQGVPRFSLSHSVTWEGLQDERVIFTAITDQAPYRAAIDAFRQNLGLGLGGVALVFVLVQFLALRWGLIPLLRMQREVVDLERGQRDQLSEGYPSELQDLAAHLQHFVTQEQNQRRRYRQALDNLAHSLKTPLSVISNALKEPQPSSTLLQDQVSRMQDVIRGQLNKATLAAPAALGQRTAAEELLMRLVSALRTAYPNVHIQTRFNATGPLRGDASDLMEIFGNVLENACKFCRGRVVVELAAEDLRQSAQAKLRVTIEDDGAGIAVNDRQQVVQRGQRADSQAPGQGIGLSVTAELVDLYQGELTISDSDLGGARICITLPGFDPVQ